MRTVLTPDRAGVLRARTARWIVVLLVGVLALAGITVARAASVPGDLDPTFGSSGRTALPALTSNQGSGLVLALPGGSTLVTDRLALVQLTPDGSPSPLFGSGGQASLPSGFVVTGLALDGQGRILVTGGDPSDVSATRLLRLLPSGAPDPAFGSGGVVSVDVDPGEEEFANSVAVDAAGDYVVSGSDVGQSKPTLVRWHPDGTLDTSLNGTGSKVFTTVDFVEGTRVRIDGDAILFGGRGDLSADAALVVARVTRAGDLDPGFGTGGTAATQPVTLGTSPFDFVVLPDRAIRAAGTVQPGSAATARGVVDGLTAGGAPDTRVGPLGRQTYDLSPGSGTIFRALSLRDDDLYVAGAVDARFEGPNAADRGATAAVVRLSTAGVLDPGFGTGGVSRDPGPNFTLAAGVGVDDQLRPVALVASVDPTAGTATYSAVRFVGRTPPPPPAPAPAPVTVTVTTPAPPPPPPPVPSTTPPRLTPVRAASVLKLPSAKRCVSRRRVKLVVALPTGVRLARLTAKVGKARTRVVRPGASLSLAGRPKGKVKVVVSATLRDGRRLTRTVTYTLCAAKKKGRRA